MIQKAFKGYEWMYGTVEEVGHPVFSAELHSDHVWSSAQPT